MHKAIVAGFLIAYLAFVLVLTLVLFRQVHPPVNLVPFRSIVEDWQTGGRAFVVNFVGNIAVLMPFGLLLPSIRPQSTRLIAVLCFCFILSVLIESMQYLGARRVADVDDVLLNTLGGGLGYLLRGRFVGDTRPNPTIASDLSNGLN